MDGRHPRLHACRIALVTVASAGPSGITANFNAPSGLPPPLAVLAICQCEPCASFLRHGNREVARPVVPHGVDVIGQIAGRVGLRVVELDQKRFALHAVIVADPRLVWPPAQANVMLSKPSCLIVDSRSCGHVVRQVVRIGFDQCSQQGDLLPAVMSAAASPVGRRAWRRRFARVAHVLGSFVGNHRLACAARATSEPPATRTPIASSSANTRNPFVKPGPVVGQQLARIGAEERRRRRNHLVVIDHEIERQVMPLDAQPPTAVGARFAKQREVIALGIANHAARAALFQFVQNRLPTA